MEPDKWNHDGRPWMEVRSQQMNNNQRLDRGAMAMMLQNARKLCSDGGVAL